MKRINKLIGLLAMPLIMSGCTPSTPKEPSKVRFSSDEHSHVYYGDSGDFEHAIYALVASSTKDYVVLDDKNLPASEGSVYFAVTYDEGYEADGLPVVSGTVGETYEKLETYVPATKSDKTYYVIKGVKADVQVTVASKESHKSSKEDGYTVTFTTEHCKVLVYATQDYTLDAEETNVTASRNSDTGEYTKYVPASEGVAEVKPQVNFKVVCDEGYFVSVDDITISGLKGTDYNAVKSQGNDIYRVTVIKADLAITISAKSAPVVDDPSNGYAVTFNLQHCKVLVYATQNYAETPEETTTTASRDADTGKYSKYVAADAEAGVTEIKPQVNFKVVADDGYVVEASNISISGTKGTEYNNIKAQGNDIYRVTVIKADITITIVASAL